MNKYACVISFMAGGIVGAVAMRVWMKRQSGATSEADEQTMVIDQLKEALAEDDVIEGELVDEEPEREKYVELAKIYQPQETPTASNGSPYVISPMEWGDFEDYQCISLTLTADGVLLDDNFEPVEDIDNTVGKDYASNFGTYPDDPDTVYIRNDALCSDFEIYKDLRTAADFEAGKAHMRWRNNE